MLLKTIFNKNRSLKNGSYFNNLSKIFKKNCAISKYPSKTLK